MKLRKEKIKDVQKYYFPLRFTKCYDPKYDHYWGILSDDIVFKYDDKKLILLGGQFTARGVVTYARDFDAVLNNYNQMDDNEFDHYIMTRYDVVYNLYNDDLSLIQKMLNDSLEKS